MAKNRPNKLISKTVTKKLMTSIIFKFKSGSQFTGLNQVYFLLPTWGIMKNMSPVYYCVYVCRGREESELHNVYVCVCAQADGWDLNSFLNNVHEHKHCIHSVIPGIG